MSETMHTRLSLVQTGYANDISVRSQEELSLQGEGRVQGKSRERGL